MAHQAAAHLLIALALLKGVAGAVAVLEKGEAAAGKLRFYKVLDDGFLVLDGYIVPVDLVIDGDTGVACYAEGFCHGAFSCGIARFWRSNSEMQAAFGRTASTG